MLMFSRSEQSLFQSLPSQTAADRSFACRPSYYGPNTGPIDISQKVIGIIFAFYFCMRI